MIYLFTIKIDLCGHLLYGDYYYNANDKKVYVVDPGNEVYVYIITNDSIRIFKHKKYSNGGLKYADISDKVYKKNAMTNADLLSAVNNEILSKILESV